MANIKSAKKRIRVIEKKTLMNRMVKSALKTTIKKFETAVLSGNVEEAKVTYVAVVKALDMAASKGVIHKNNASRKKSRLTARFNALSA
jgi:small subunit ribosomal protein S20